jgi:flagellar assembly factor FliW
MHINCLSYKKSNISLVCAKPYSLRWRYMLFIQNCLNLPFDIVSSKILSGKVTIDILSNVKFLKIKL